MDGVKEFINHTCSDLNVKLTVRERETPGCTFRIEEFCLLIGECKKVCFGNELNPFLDCIYACYCNFGQCAKTELAVRKIGCEVDKFINLTPKILFLNAGPSIVISSLYWYHAC
ncbi:hypothetical protein [Clostridium sp. KNHs205]|jgi:hypothetical protein|uniref:hypothetical protein n=1 Tax=Clostridium sp. KNHs205 TaxID=1449050 RepID=UPI00051B352B|nr:hypothetical protein [Clostridium sp. KNHs205]